MFAAVFDVDSVDLDDDFFALGGDSLIAAALVGEIERHTGVSLSLSALINAATPRLLAARIADARRESFSRILIPVRPSGQGLAIFSVHGMGGDDLFTHRFAAALGGDRPVWTFRAKGLTAGEHPVTGIEAMASLYLEAMRSVQPDGPYLLMGHCAVGTFVAWEMARQLAAAGDTVAGLILMELPTNRKWAPFFHTSGLTLEAVRSHWLREAANASAWIEAHPEATPEQRREHIDTIMSAAAATYVPKPVQCPALLVSRVNRADTALNPRNGYHKLIAGARVFLVEGTHRDVLEDRLGDSIPEIRAFLDRVAPVASSAAER